MTSQEVELWARDIAEVVLSGTKWEDSRVELKSEWPEDSNRAAKRLAGHANAARGEGILWIIGLKEDPPGLTNVEPTEMATWWSKISSEFDGFPPRLETQVNIRIQNKKVVALYFTTRHEAPYVVRHKDKSSFPEFVVPWREGTRLRTARRDELLCILVPKQSLVGLKTELEFNLRLEESQRDLPSFRLKEFDKVFSSGGLESLPQELKFKLMDALSHMETANRWVKVALNTPPLQDIYEGASFDSAKAAVTEAFPSIKIAFQALSL